MVKPSSSHSSIKQNLLQSLPDVTASNELTYATEFRNPLMVPGPSFQELHSLSNGSDINNLMATDVSNLPQLRTGSSILPMSHPHRSLCCKPGEDNFFSTMASIRQEISLLDQKSLTVLLILQEKLKLKDPNITNAIFKRAFPHIFFWMSDKYGCNFFINLIEACNPMQISEILLLMEKNCGEFYKASQNIYGAKSIKKLIKVTQKSTLIYRVIPILYVYFFDMMVHPTASTIIETCIDILKPEQSMFLYAQAKKYCIKLAEDKQGCIALNKFISHSSFSIYRDQILNEICKNAVYLSAHSSGNYVVQHVLALENTQFTAMICENLKNQYVNLSFLKEGSHVVEKCLKSTKRNFALEGLKSSDKLVKLACHKYGNYVIQTALRVSKSEDYRETHEVLLAVLRQNCDCLLFGYGKNVLNLIVNEL